MSNVRTVRTEAKLEKFLENLRDGMTITEACRAAAVDFTTQKLKRDTDPDFLAKFEDAYRAGADVLATEARRRAVDGVSEPVYYLGKVVGTVRKHSDILLMFMMKARDPHTYCDKLRAARVLAAEEAAKKRKDAEEAAGVSDFDGEVFERLEAISQAKTANRTVN